MYSDSFKKYAGIHIHILININGSSSSLLAATVPTVVEITNTNTKPPKSRPQKIAWGTAVF